MYSHTMTEVTITTGDLLTPEQAAEMLNVHLVTVYRWIKAERLMNCILGGRVFVLTSQVKKIKAEREGNGK